MLYKRSIYRLLRLLRLLMKLLLLLHRCLAAQNEFESKT
jgi:hypothetical protein